MRKREVEREFRRGEAVKISICERKKEKRQEREGFEVGVSSRGIDEIWENVEESN